MATQKQIDSFFRQYVVTALWSSTGDDDEPLDKQYSLEDIADEAQAKMRADCEKFIQANEQYINDDNLLRTSDSDTYGSAGHDFWLNRNGHGAGFWDGDWEESAGRNMDESSKSFGNCDLYLGDDGKLYLA